MPKLLSQDEVHQLAAAMTAEYGLPPPDIGEDSYGSSVSVVIYREIKVTRLSKYFKIKSLETAYKKIGDLYASNYEEALTKLEQELNKLNARAGIAERFREKFAMQEADEALSEVLRNETPIV